ncbi:MAG TPA: hypothetical protein VGB38_05545 [bacterium]
MGTARLLSFWAAFLVLFPSSGIHGQVEPFQSGMGFEECPAFDRSDLLPESDRGSSDSARTAVPAKAFFLSLMLPGAGEYYAGSTKMGNAFLCTEIALWGCYAMFRAYGDCREQDYKLFAAAHAGVDLNGKDPAFFVNVEDHSSLTDYNDLRLKQRYWEALYPEDQTHFWKWDSDASRLRFKALRLSSDRAYNRALIVVGAIVANHIVSGIDAVRVAKKKERLNLRIVLNAMGNRGMAVSVVKGF